MARYIVAVRRLRRVTGATTDEFREIPGVTVIGGDALRLVVEAPAAVIADVKGRFDKDLLIEPEIAHQIS